MSIVLDYRFLDFLEWWNLTEIFPDFCNLSSFSLLKFLGKPVAEQLTQFFSGTLNQIFYSAVLTKKHVFEKKFHIFSKKSVLNLGTYLN